MCVYTARKKKSFLVKVVDSQQCGRSTSDIGRPFACVQREPKINSEEGETTPCVGRPLLLGPSHAGGLLLSHSNAQNRKLVWPIRNAREEEEGGGGVGWGVVLCSCRGGSVYPGHCRFLLAPFPVCLRAHTPRRHPGRLTCKEV